MTDTAIEPKASNPNLFLYVLARGDLESMGEGKTAAQATHAGNQFTDEHIIRPLLAGQRPSDEVMDWRTHADGFGTTIVLDAPQLADMRAVIDVARRLGFAANLVYDPTYPYEVAGEMVDRIDPSIHTEKPIRLPTGRAICFCNEITTAYIFGDRDKLAPLLKRFKLLRND